MGFETFLGNKNTEEQMNNKAVPMGFETQYSLYLPLLCNAIIKQSLWDLKLWSIIFGANFLLL